MKCKLCGRDIGAEGMANHKAMHRRKSRDKQQILSGYPKCKKCGRGLEVIKGYECGCMYCDRNKECV